MKAAVLHEYGPAKNLLYEDAPDPSPGKGEVLVRVAAVSINPIDYKIRSGAARERFPLELPAILGRDAAGLIRQLGEGVSGFELGERVMALTNRTYAELVVVKAEELARVPDGLELPQAGALPLVVATGDQLLHLGAQVKQGETVLVTGALGSVGRVAVFAALETGARVIAGVRKRQREEARALGVADVIALDDAADLQRLGTLDAVADTVGGEVATALLAKVRPGGRFGSVLGVPKDAGLHPTVQVNAIMAQPDPRTLERYAEAVRDGRLKIPVDRMLPLAQAGEGQTAAEKGGVGKIVLLA